jgi:hypothetical protein
VEDCLLVETCRPYSGEGNWKIPCDMNGVFLACGQGRGASIGLEDQEEEEQDAVDEADNHAQHPSELDHLEATEDCVPENDLEPANINLESSEDEKDLIDRQLESDCLEICADHHQAVLRGGKAAKQVWRYLGEC